MIGNGSERGPVALPVFKIGRCLFGGRLGSTPRRFRQPLHALRLLIIPTTALVSLRSSSATSAPAASSCVTE
jgi:hypothetical protein